MKKKRKWGQIVSGLLGLLVGAVIGMVMSANIDAQSFGEFFIKMSVGLLILLLSFYLHTMIHEAGHLVFGLLSGYSFTSFRIGSFQWTKTNGKLRFSRFSLAGTGGQCLMCPPDSPSGKVPVVLYNLGGSIMNLIVGGIALAIYLLMDMDMIGSFVFSCMALAGLLTAMVNGIPLRMNMIDNDGYNALSLRKNPTAMDAFVLQLNVNACIAQGQRLQEMPDQWFRLPPDEDMQNSLVAVQGAIASSRLLDQQNYAEAYKLIGHLLSIPSGLTALNRNAMICDQLCCEMLGQNRREVVDTLLTKDVRNFMNIMKKNPSVIRTEYIYALLVEHDPIKAEKSETAFEKVRKTYPYPNDMLADRAMMENAKRRQEQEI